MRSTFGRFLGLLCFVLASLVAGGSPSAATPFAGTLSITAGTLGTVNFYATSSGTSTSGLVTIPATLFAGVGTALVTNASVVTKIVVNVAGQPAGSFAGTPLGGAMPLNAKAFVIGLGSITLVKVPLALGSVNTFMTSPYTLVDYIDVFNTDWTVGNKLITGLTTRVTNHGGMSTTTMVTMTGVSASYSGTDSRTPGGIGQITLISPTKITGSLAGGFFPFSFVSLGTLTLNFVPEPGTLLLVGTGAAALAAIGRRRRSSSRRG